jgi:catalase
LFAYGDAHRYRLGINHTQLPVNQPKAATVDNYGRDGLMRFDDNGAMDKNYEPNSFDGPVESGEPHYAGIEGGLSGSYEWDERETDNFTQAGALYRVMTEAERSRLIDSIAGDLSGASKDEIIERSLAHFTAADAEYGARLRVAVEALRS